MYKASGGKKADIISHSMGGILVKSFLALHHDVRHLREINFTVYEMTMFLTFEYLCNTFCTLFYFDFYALSPGSSVPVGLQFFEKYVNSWITIAAPFQGENFVFFAFLSLVVSYQTRHNVTIFCCSSDLKAECDNLVTRCSRVHHGLPAHRSRICQRLATTALCGQVEYASACMNLITTLPLTFQFGCISFYSPMNFQE